MSKIRVMLIEDNPEYRRVIAPALNDESDLEVVSQFGTVERALSSLQADSQTHGPDIILLDLNLPGMTGLMGIDHFRAAVPDAKIIVLTQSDKEADVLRAISLGAAGYLLKSATLRQISEGIRTVTGGGALLDAGVAKLIIQTLKDLLPVHERSELLTTRETEVLRLLAEGHERKSIANQLHISTATVCTHIGHIFDKLQVQNAPAAVAKAFRVGVFPAEKQSAVIVDRRW
jgi:two-component system nitrate/nitrite response regulator NarL